MKPAANALEQFAKEHQAVCTVASEDSSHVLSFTPLNKGDEKEISEAITALSKAVPLMVHEVWQPTSSARSQAWPALSEIVTLTVLGRQQMDRIESRVQSLTRWPERLEQRLSEQQRRNDNLAIRRARLTSPAELRERARLAGIAEEAPVR